MVINNIHILQRDNVYQLYLPTQLCIGQLALPPDQQYILDSRALEYITKAMAMRWNVYEKPKQKC